MRTSQKKKNQHYVPRTLLRGFSVDGRSISLLVLKSGRRVSGASIGDQCSRNYYYGKDGTIENGLSVIEGRFAAALGDRSLSRLERVSGDDEMNIVFFVHLQRGRTVGAAASVAAVTDGMARQVLEKDVRIKRMGIDLSQFRFERSDPQIDALHHTLTSGPVVFDLEVKFLVANKKPKFVISDDPVVLHNQWAEQHPRFRCWPAVTGLAHKGLQIFMPVSADVCIALFDRSTYEYGSPTSKVCTPSVRDIKTLNDLQALNARDNIYFDGDQTADEELERLRVFHASHGGLRAPNITISNERDEGDGRRSQLIRIRHRSPRLGHSFGFVRVIDHDAYDGWNRVTIPIRSPEAVTEMERLNTTA